uniref:GATA transcription factor 7-like n=1 Tax=Erigeron canadensis TaxID=72917 RepID=UPI001CB96CDA|nr:GATA transcription factor 7-like [Erigeron canadensis]
MDFCRNVSVSGGFPANYQPEQKLLSPSFNKLGSLDDLFSCHSMEQSDINTEWLSAFMEDCLSSSGSCLPSVKPLNPPSTASNAQRTNSQEVQKKLQNYSLHKLVVPCKARSKRKRSQFKSTSHLCWYSRDDRVSQWSVSDPIFRSRKNLFRSQHYTYNNDESLLLHQDYWLADSELILPTKSTSQNCTKDEDYGQGVYKQIKHEEEEGSSFGQGRRCTHCLSQRTPQWRAGPDGPKTLCNACGVRYKSGRLLPEYRPAKSPSFVSYKHSNSHKKVLEMRMCSSSSC